VALAADRDFAAASGGVRDDAAGQRPELRKRRRSHGFVPRRSPHPGRQQPDDPRARVLGRGRRPIHQLVVGSDATPADIASRFDVLRHTTAGAAGTAPVEKPTDPQAPAASCNLRGGTMTEPTYEADFLLEIALNQRATFTWIANPGRELRTGGGHGERHRPALDLLGRHAEHQLHDGLGRVGAPC
jgi:hypothetical protein